MDHQTCTGLQHQGVLPVVFKNREWVAFERKPPLEAGRAPIALSNHEHMGGIWNKSSKKARFRLALRWCKRSGRG